MSISLYDHQLDAINKMKNGCILCGGVGSGKSRTSLAYYYIQQGGKLDANARLKNSKNLYIITTAKKRDSLEWEDELSVFSLSATIDSWNNIKKYAYVSGSFFIFDEQRVVGSGAWVRAFLKIAKRNDWILLSATPGDTWADYIPVFIANGFYKNKTEFNSQHAVYVKYGKFWKPDKYIGTNKLNRLRNEILVDMDFKRDTIPNNIDILCEYDKEKYKEIMKTRWDPYKNEPIQQAAGLCYVLRKLVNSDESRSNEILSILKKHPKAIIFYSYDYELDILKSIDYGPGVKMAEWNGHKHQSVPEGDKWVYFVQYTSGSEGWNCITTDTIIFYSQTYSYKVLSQASGRIDRINTPYKDLYYYHLKTKSAIDIAIGRALKQKKTFNESRWITGAAIGSFATQSILKTKYEKIYDEYEKYKRAA